MDSKRLRISEGIYRDRHGLAARVHVRGVQREQRYPEGTPIRVMQRWRQATAEAIRATRATQPRAQAGTLAADVDLYLKTLADRPRLQAERRVQLAWWASKFGHRGRYTLARGELAAALAELAATPFVRFRGRPPMRRSVSSVGHYRTALFHLFTTLDGRNAPNPLRDVPAPVQPELAARALPYAVVEALFAVMPDRGSSVRGGSRPTASRSKARLKVMAYVGLPPAQIAQLRPEHLDWHAPAVVVHGRRKGKGTRAQRLPLTERGVTALRELFACGGNAPFSASSAARSFRRAIARLDAETRAQLSAFRPRPYDLRHSFLTHVYRISGDIRATQLLAMHSDSRMTHRYTLAAVDERLQRVVRQIDNGGVE